MLIAKINTKYKFRIFSKYVYIFAYFYIVVLGSEFSCTTNTYNLLSKHKQFKRFYNIYIVIQYPQKFTIITYF